MGFIEVMKERRMLAQLTHEEELTEHLGEGSRTAYAGFDPTAASLHVGHLLPVIALRRWQQAGHRSIALMGGGTAMVGDPTGKAEMRQMLSIETIDRNIASIQKQLALFLDLSSEDRGLVVNNGDWLRGLEYLAFLREFGSQFSVNRMLTADSVKARLEKGLSFLEFNYMILQSYDFLHLNKVYDCSVQLGGDDQWSNMLGGMDLIRRKEHSKAFCCTVPLLVNGAGQKMGKTEAGAIWLDPNRTPPYDLFQYFRNVEDEMVTSCLYYFSDLPASEVQELDKLQGKNINEAKIILAYEITKLIHGEEQADKARQAASKLFGGVDDEKAKEDAPKLVVDRQQFGETANIVDLLLHAGFMNSKNEIRRLISGGGLCIEGKKVDDIKYELPLSTLGDKGVLLKKGKKHYYHLAFFE